MCEKDKYNNYFYFHHTLELNTQNMRKSCFLICLLFSTCIAHSQSSVNGVWHSSFSVMGQSFLMDLEIDMDQLSILMSNPELEGGPKIPVQDVIYSDVHISFAWKAGGLSFVGNYFPTGDSLSGQMKQSGLEWHAAFFREVQKKNVAIRPQQPQAPFPYESKEISYKNTKDGTEIFATLTFPIFKTSDYPIVVLASGSGPQDRNCSILGHQPFLLIADQFARNGIATLRFDDRGTGNSSASYADATLTDFGNDVVSSVDYLSNQKEFKGHKIGLLGHSEGGMHILLAQKMRSKKVKFMVFLASIGGTGLEAIVQQQYDIALKNGETEELARWNQSLFKAASDCILKEKDVQKCKDQIDAMIHQKIELLPEDVSKDMKESELSQMLNGLLNNAWGREFLSFDAQQYLADYSTPAIAVFGGEDIQVEPTINARKFNEGFQKAKNDQANTQVLPGLNHLLQTCKSCSVFEYGELTETMNPAVFQTIIPFIISQK